jgi:hypothetical protein
MISYAEKVLYTSICRKIIPAGSLACESRPCCTGGASVMSGGKDCPAWAVYIRTADINKQYIIPICIKPGLFRGPA